MPHYPLLYNNFYNLSIAQKVNIKMRTLKTLQNPRFFANVKGVLNFLARLSPILIKKVLTSLSNKGIITLCGYRVIGKTMN
jgi:hypothetical protein